MKVILVCGARPNFMKIAPLMRAIERYNGSMGREFIEPILVHTGQHYDYEMSKIFFEELEIPEPSIYLGVGSGTHGQQTARVMMRLERVLIKERPDLVVVVGDVNSTLAAALAAVKVHIPVAHVEAGLRSYDRDMPEEINRLLTDHISTFLFTTSRYDDANLEKENIAADKIFCVGNIMVDNLLFNRDMAKQSNVLSKLGLKERDYALLTLHRPSNVDSREGLTNILTAIKSISQEISVVFPVHPRTRKNIKSFRLDDIFNHSHIISTEPLGYLDFLKLEMNSKLIITDSGGIQVETTALNIPCLTILNSTGWTITLKQGTNTIVGNNGQKLMEETFKILDGKGKKGSCPELWDGKAAERIVEIMVRGVPCTSDVAKQYESKEAARHVLQKSWCGTNEHIGERVIRGGTLIWRSP